MISFRDPLAVAGALLLLLTGALVAGAFVIENEPSNIQTEPGDMLTESSEFQAEST